MPNKVYICIHCGDTDGSFDEVLEHEKFCDFNEDAKTCGTCIHYEERGYPISGSNMECRNKDCNLYGKSGDYLGLKTGEESQFPCKYWKEEEL